MSCVACVSPSPLLGVFAGVAVYSTPLAITAHLAPELGFLGGDALESAAARVVETDFGQTDFGHRYPTDFGQSDFGQTDFGQTDFGQR